MADNMCDVCGVARATVLIGDRALCSGCALARIEKRAEQVKKARQFGNVKNDVP